MATTPLALNADELSACVSCGLCLPTCPTYRVTGRESASPRGRIGLMRAIESGASELNGVTATFFDECVQCRACDVACPSGVPFGHLIEDTKAAMAGALPRRRSLLTRVAFRIGLGTLGHQRLLRVGGAAAVLGRQVLPTRLGIPRVPLRQIFRKLTVVSTTQSPVILFTGCVMDVWQRDVHQDTINVLEKSGACVEISGSAAPCCGALHLHAGDRENARKRAVSTMASLGDSELPILVNSAGCGAALKDYGRLIGTPAAHHFSSRVMDVHEWLAADPERIQRLALQPTGRSVVVQDPCHLKNAQRLTAPVRTVLSGAYTIIETSDDGVCCGAGGAYSVLQPTLSIDIRQRKVEALHAAMDAAGAPQSTVVASGNPGCMMHLACANVVTQHPMSLVAAAMSLVAAAGPLVAAAGPLVAAAVASQSDQS